MANILGNVFKGKDGINGGLAAQGIGQTPVHDGVRSNSNIVNLQTSGRSGGSSYNSSTAAQLARERAEAAKAQIEMRKAAEARRKDDSSDKNDITPVGLKPPIKRPKSASINHAQYVAEQQQQQHDA